MASDTDRRGTADQLGSRSGTALVALWMLAAALAVRQAAAVLRLPPEERLTDLAAWLGDSGVLQVPGSLYDGASFTGTPFAGLVLKPLTRAVEEGLGVVWTFGTLLLVAGVGLVAARQVPGAESGRARLIVVPVAISLLALSIPVRNTFSLGQLSILPVLMVLIACLTGIADGRRSGVLIGLAAALQPVVLLFAPLLWLTGRRPAAVTAGGVFAGATAVAWAAMPRDSWTYWVHHVAGAGLGAPADIAANQSLHGLLLRCGLRGPLEIVLLLLLVTVVAAVGLRRAAGYHRDGQPLLATAVTGCVAVAAAPAAWQHQQLWILLAVVGRVGRRRADRLVWPVFVVLVMSLSPSALVPNVPLFGFLGENAPLLAALLAACAVPFLSRGAPVWDRPEPSGPLSRPQLVLELMAIRVGYWAYSWIRGSAPDGRAAAEEHGRQILAVEQALRIDVERWLNQTAVRWEWLESSMNFYYSAFHFLVPIILLVWLYLRSPGRYRQARTALSAATLLGLVGFWLYPLAPPRLMPGLGYVDTAHGPQDLSDPDFGALTELSNQYAAMPSLHVGWALWCGVIAWRLLPRGWGRTLGVLYPVLTTVVVMGTANHYLLDAAGGVAVAVAGFGGQRLWQRYGPGSGRAAVREHCAAEHRCPEQEPGVRVPAAALSTRARSEATGSGRAAAVAPRPDPRRARERAGYER